MINRRNNMSKIKIYFGAPLFSESEQMYNDYIVSKIRKQFGEQVDVYNPQENEALNDKAGYADATMIFNGDNEYLDNSDILIALLDGQTIDAGLASEIGRFSVSGKLIIGLYTDSRQGTYGNQQKIDALDEIAENQFHYLNLYTVGAIKENGFIVKSVRELVEDIGQFIKGYNGEI